MTNFERVIELVSQLQTIEINSNDGILNNIIIDVDTYDIYDNIISIGSLNGSEINIAANDIVEVNGQIVVLKNYRLEFITK